MAGSTVTSLHQQPEDQRFAETLADVRKMRDELLSARTEIGQLKADLHREEDRVALLTEDRDRYRHDAFKFRTLLIELATKMADIGLLTLKAQELMQTVNELDTARTPSSEAVTKLAEAHQKGHTAAAVA